MIVSELIARLQKMPQDVPAHIFYVLSGSFIVDVSGVFFVEANEEYGEEAEVVIAVV